MLSNGSVVVWYGCGWRCCNFDKKIVHWSHKCKTIDDIGKVTDENIKEELCKTNDDIIPQNTADLFHDCNGDELSNSDNIVKDKRDIRTCSDNKKKAENSNDNTEDGKKQRGYDKE